MNKNLPEFDVSMKVVNGKTIPVIKAKAETITREDGSKSVIIHVPTLSLINKSIKK